MASISATIQAVGRVVEIDTETTTFQLRIGDDRRVPCGYDTDSAELVRDTLNVDGDGPLVEVEGLALVDADGQIQRFPGPVRLAAILRLITKIGIGTAEVRRGPERCAGKDRGAQGP